MHNTSKLNGIFFRIWIFACLINALLSAIVLFKDAQGVIGGFVLISIFSFIFSLPILIGTLLLSYLFVSLRLIPNVFLHVLLVCFICAGSGAFFYSDILYEIDHKSLELCACIVLSSLLAALCCYKSIQRTREDADEAVPTAEEIFNNHSTTVL